MLMQKARSYAEVYNDLDGELVNVFRVLRNPTQARELRRLLELTPFARDEFEMSYTSDGDPIEQARRTIIRSFMGFGSNAHNQQRDSAAIATARVRRLAHDWMHTRTTGRCSVSDCAGVVIENRTR